MLGMRWVLLAAAAGASGCSLVNDFDAALAGDYTGTYQVLQGSSQESAGTLSLVITPTGRCTGVMARTDRSQPSVTLEDCAVRDTNSLQFGFRYVDTSRRQVTGPVGMFGSILEPVEDFISVSFSGGSGGTMRFSLLRR